MISAHNRTMIAIQNIVKMTTVPILSTSESTSHRSGSSKKCLKPFRTESGTAVKAKKLDKKMTSRTCPQILESFQFPPPFATPWKYTTSPRSSRFRGYHRRGPKLVVGNSRSSCKPLSWRRKEFCLIWQRLFLFDSWASSQTGLRRHRPWRVVRACVYISTLPLR